MLVNDKYVLFWGDKDIYSNFFIVSFEYAGHKFKTSEHAFMYAKAIFFEAHDIANKILKASSPLEAKKLGRQISNYDDNKWNAARVGIMEEVVFAKFSQNLRLKETILATGNRTFVEASPYDKIWGVGLSEKDPRVQNPSQWKGLNLLGKVLTNVRKRLQSM